MIYISWDFWASNHCWAFYSLLWLSKLSSNHSATVTTLLYYIINIYMTLDSNLCKNKISTICLEKQLINIYKAWYKYFKSGIIYVQNWRVRELLKCFLAIQTQLTNRPQVITNQTDHRWTFGTPERPWTI